MTTFFLSILFLSIFCACFQAYMCYKKSKDYDYNLKSFFIDSVGRNIYN